MGRDPKCPVSVLVLVAVVANEHANDWAQCTLEMFHCDTNSFEVKRMELML